MKTPLQDDISYAKAGAVVFGFFVATIFCYWIQFPLILPLILFFLGTYLFFTNKATYRLFLRLGLLLCVLVFGMHVVVSYTTISPLYIPVASVAMLTMLLFNDLHLAFLMALASSFLAGYIIPPETVVIRQPLNLMLIFFIGGLTAAFSVRNARTRGKQLIAGLYAGIIQVSCIILLYPLMSFMPSRTFTVDYMLPFIFNGLLAGCIVMVVLKIFETLFGVLTNFSLLELSDFNHPLLRRMVLEAPGTYHHSLIVSNLAEAAAEAIGANSLLTRVGAYYHDIGKLEKPEYFTENQLAGGNKHDDIEPSISRLVILNHVKEGLELGKKYKLNPMILNFIPQHHGTALMYYFYQKALEEAEDPDSVSEENFRYPGPKPQTRETAIVMMADSVEGATRALDEQTPTRIAEVVRKVINNKFIDGQLDECNLTLKEIELIAATFSRVLSAMYHGRVKYPEKSNGHDYRNPKPAEESPDTPVTDQKDRPKNSSS
jgi:cyclic-di-AMP phosphodiesterase PgpH